MSSPMPPRASPMTKPRLPLPASPPPSAAAPLSARSPFSPPSGRYVGFEDYQKDMQKYLQAVSQEESSVALSRRSSEPALGATEGATASDIAKIGGFRREFVRKQDPPCTKFASDTEHSPRKGGAAHPASSSPPSLVDDIEFHLNSLLDFYQGIDAENRQGLFDDRTVEEMRRETGLPPPKARPGVSLFKTYVNLFKSFVVTTFLFLPSAFALAGYIPSILMILLAGVASGWAIIKLVDCAKSQSSSFIGLAEKAYGRRGQVLVGFCQAFSHFMFACCGTYFNCSTVASVVSNLRGEDVAGHENDPAHSDFFYISAALLLVVLVPLSFIRRIGNMQYTNMISSVCITWGVLFVIVMASKQIYENGGRPAKGVVMVNTKESDSFMSVLSFIGTAVYLFEGIGLALPIRAAMAEPQHFPKAVVVVISFLTFFLVFFGMIGYWAWGENVTSVVLSQPEASWLKLTTQLLYVGAILLNYPLQLYPTFATMEAFIPSLRKMAPSPRRTWIKNGIRSLLCVLIVSIAVAAASNVEMFVSIIGSICAIPLAVVIPAVLHYRLVTGAAPIKEKGGRVPSKADKISDIVLISLGGLLVPLTFVVNVYMWVKSSGH